MSIRRAVGSLLTRRFSPRATPRTAAARTLRSSLRDLSIGGGLRAAARVAAAALAGGGGTFAAIQYFKKGADDDESAARKKEVDMKARFEDWAKKYNRTYRDEEEKAMRFEAFKDTVKWIESQPPSLREMLLPLNSFADFKKEECSSGRSCRPCIVDIDGPDTQEYRENKFLAENDNGEAFVWKPAVKQGHKQSTQVSA